MKDLLMKKRFGLTILVSFFFIQLFAQESEEDPFNYKPELHGTIRGKYEFQFQDAEHRFEVRNARFGFSGKVHPMIGYKAEIDLSNEGSIKTLDAFARLFPNDDCYFTIGQMRVPFTIDAHRSPHKQYFANRSFIAKQVGNVRDVGLSGAYKLKHKDILYVFEGGIYNGSGIRDQKKWHKTLNYSLKTQIFPNENWNVTLSTQMIKPQFCRVNMYDVGAYYQFNNLHVEAEYLYKTYNKNAFDNVHAFNSFVNYDFILDKFFYKVSLLARYDMMTDHSTGVTDDVLLKIDDYKRHRISGGVTLSFIKAFTADIRINVEKYFYRDGAIKKPSECDKIVFELVTHF